MYNCMAPTDSSYHTSYDRLKCSRFAACKAAQDIVVGTSATKAGTIFCACATARMAAVRSIRIAISNVAPTGKGTNLSEGVTVCKERRGANFALLCVFASVSILQCWLSMGVTHRSRNPSAETD